MKILLTGVAGFIGFHLAEYLLKDGFEVVGFDSVNDYYEPGLKWNRLKELGIYESNVDGELVQSVTYPSFRFIRMQLEDEEGIMRLFEREHFDIQTAVHYRLL